MAHINTNPGDYDQTVSAYIYRQTEQGLKVLLHWHKKLNCWLQFGGHIEHGENAWQAVSHELIEESGYQLSQLRVLQPSQPNTELSTSIDLPTPFVVNAHQTDSDRHFHSDMGFLFIANEPPSKKPKTGESQKLSWFTLKELEALSVTELSADSLAICRIGFERLMEWQQMSATSYKLNNPSVSR